jgi:hypothetical protein
MVVQRRFQIVGTNALSDKAWCLWLANNSVRFIDELPVP